MSQDISWGWLEESEAKLNLKAENHLAAEDQRTIGLRLIACIKEMREGLSFYGDVERSRCVCPGGSFVAKPDVAIETLNRCARGEFEK